LLRSSSFVTLGLVLPLFHIQFLLLLMAAPGAANWHNLHAI
jgi:hypothetical protein